MRRSCVALAMTSCLFVLPMAIAADAPVATSRPSTIDPQPRPDKWWQDRHAAMNERVSKGDVDLIFIGDSITQGWEGPGRAVWEKYYTKRNAVNLGIGGDRTEHVLWRLDHGNIEGIKPKAAVIMIGTNNSKNDSVQDIALGVTTIVKTLRERLPDTKILVCAIFPRGQAPNDQRGKILQINQIINKLHDGKNVWFADFGYKFIESDGTLAKEVMPDYLHLSTKAYETWAQAIEPKLAKMMGEK